MIGPISLTLYYLIRAFPFWRQLPFSSLFGHQTHFPEDPVTDLKLPEAYCFVKVPSRSILISRPGNLSIIFFFFLQEIQVQVDTFIVESWVVVCYSEARRPNFCRNDRLSPISEGKGGVTSWGSNSCPIRPEYFGDILHPSSFLLPELLLQPSH
jgi:hypothetical protein